MSDIRTDFCPSCELPFDDPPGMGCRYRHGHEPLMPRESYRGPSPRDEGWTWPATTAFVALLVFVAFLVWMVWR